MHSGIDELKTETTAFGLPNIRVIIDANDYRQFACASIRDAILAIPEDERDAWYLPDSERNWAYWGGKVAYSFHDEAGDSSYGFYCGACAEKAILAGEEPREYLQGMITSLEDPLNCDACGEEVSN